MIDNISDYYQVYWGKRGYVYGLIIVHVVIFNVSGLFMSRSTSVQCQPNVVLISHMFKATIICCKGKKYYWSLKYTYKLQAM
jgi:hypothetical protein